MSCEKTDGQPKEQEGHRAVKVPQFRILRWRWFREQQCQVLTVVRTQNPPDEHQREKNFKGTTDKPVPPKWMTLEPTQEPTLRWHVLSRLYISRPMLC